MNLATMKPVKWNQLYYDEWVAREGMELIHGYAANVFTVPLKWWPRIGADAVHIQLDGTGEMNGAYVCEMAPGKSVEPQKHLYEEMVYILSGRGATTVWYEGRRKTSFEWQAGSLFCVPINAWYQHFNLSGEEPARYVAVTTAPIMMNLLRNDDAIFNNPNVFPERYDSEEDYFSTTYRTEPFFGWDVPSNVYLTNFIHDVNAIPFENSSRGSGTRSASFEIGQGVLASHSLRAPGCTFTNIHRHGPGAHVLWLQGEGYTLMWPDGGESEKVQEFWGPGTMLVPPNWWWHQHAILSPDGAQYLALRMNSKRHPLDRNSTGIMRSSRNGGNMVNFEDFPPGLLKEVTDLFVGECDKRGVTANLEPISGV